VVKGNVLTGVIFDLASLANLSTDSNANTTMMILMPVSFQHHASIHSNPDLCLEMFPGLHWESCRSQAEVVEG
jgi:hypothetical protein